MKTIVAKTEEELAKALIEHRELHAKHNVLTISPNGKFILKKDRRSTSSLLFPEWLSVELTIKPKWYENIPGHGILCWVSNVEGRTNQKDGCVDVIQLLPSIHGRFVGRDQCWKYATPVTKDEVWEG